jgi:arylsulfatase
VDYIAKKWQSDKPFFLYVPFAFAHHPALAHPDFKGKSPAGEFGDSLAGARLQRRVGSSTHSRGWCRQEHSSDLGSDNGPSPLPTVTPYWTIGDSGPMAWRDRHSVGRNILRTPCIIRWPGQIPGGRVSNQIVRSPLTSFLPWPASRVAKFHPTVRLTAWTTRFLSGRRRDPNREHVLLFLGQKLMAVKWRNYKMHIDGLDRVMAC